MSTRSLSLVEQKRLQWNREREEMTKFYGLWAPPTTYQISHRKISDGPITTHLNKLNEVFELEEGDSNGRCLPPIQKNNFSAEYSRFHDNRNNSECNTSGYGSETDVKEEFPLEKKKQWKSQSNLSTLNLISNGGGEDMSVRMKWGDRGVGIGHLWEPTSNGDARLPEINIRPGTPHWLQRSLLNKSHFRGQNVPVESDTLLIKEQKRLKALEFQEAIKQQLQERERKRKEDKEQQLEEDRRLEQRIKKQQEIEKIRIEEEQKKLKEKEEKESKKSKAMQEALVTAELLAKEVKKKNRRKSIAQTNPIDANNNISQTPPPLSGNNGQNQFKEYDVDPPSGTTIIEITTDKLEEKPEINKNDACTSLTADAYYEDFQISIPLVTNKCTQTNTYLVPKVRKKMLKVDNERPKWGVNRPSTKYLKQSEKDLFYQKKVVRHHDPQDGFDHEPYGSSRSFDSTDESKSLSTSPNEEEFTQARVNLKLNLRKKFINHTYADNTNSLETLHNGEHSDSNNIESKDDKTTSTEEIFTNGKEQILNDLLSLSNNLKMKQNFWREEMKKMTTEIHITP